MTEEKQETERQKWLRRNQEATFYKVQPDFGKRSNTYRVSKITCGEVVDMYHVTIKHPDDDAAMEVFCDCMGFRRQKFAPRQHKHVRAVLDFLSRDDIEWAEYNFSGVGKNTTITFRRDSNGTQ